MIRAVNVGCGLDVCQLPGWENIDNSPTARLSRHPHFKSLLVRGGLIPEGVASVPWPKCIRIHDAAKVLPYPDSSLLYAYTSHFLEHLPPGTAKGFLRECYRVLTIGGILRVVVPDLLGICQEYVNAADGDEDSRLLAADRFIERTALRSTNGGERPGWLASLRRAWGRDGHYWMYDAHSLASRIEEAGFAKVTRRRFGESLIPEVELLDIPGRAAESLYVEGEKLRGQ
jgi:SAM-dependent methyltransferase